MILAAIKKDSWLLLRDRGALISLFALPVVFMLAFGSMFRFGPSAGERRAIAVWHAGDERGARIAALIDAAPGLVARSLPTADAVRAAVADEEVSAGVIVPAAEVPVELVLDLAAPEQARGPLQGALTGIVMRAAVPAGFTPPMPIVTSPPGIAPPPPKVTGLQVAVPGNAVLFGFFIALTVAMSFTTDRRPGTWRRLLAAPVPRWKALIATLVPYYLIGVMQLAFLFGIGAVAFGLTIAGDVSALILVSLAVVYCAVTLGLLMAALGGTERQLGGIGSVVLLVMGLLGGCMMPRLVMPDFMKTLGLGVPHGWALDAYYDVLVRADTTVADVAPPLLVLVGFGTGFAVLGAARFRFER